MPYISPFNDMKNLDVNTVTLYEPSPNKYTEDYVLSYEMDSEVAEVDRSYDQKIVPMGENTYSETVIRSTSVPEKTGEVPGKTDVYIHWDALTHVYFASLTVIGLFVMFRSIQNSR
jgi:hypothetical protein